MKESTAVSGLGVTGAQLGSVTPLLVTDMTLPAPIQKPAPGSTRAPPESEKATIVGIASTEE